MKKISLLILLTATIIWSCFATNKPGKSSFSIPYKQYKLENGLDVILHQDKSDPLVAVAIQYHVGSNREEPGKTGFAHLFEHMMFQQSENIGQDQYFSKIQGAAGPAATEQFIMKLYPKMLSKWFCGWNPTAWVFSETRLPGNRLSPSKMWC